MRLSRIVFGPVQDRFFFRARRELSGLSRTVIGVGLMVGSFEPRLHDAPPSEEIMAD
jgi:hypothetical protein